MTRGECEGGFRPCAAVSCKFNLCTDVSEAGRLIVHWLPDEHPERPNCALDAADSSGLSVSEVATLMRTTRQWVDQIEHKAKRKIRRRMRKVSE